MTHIWQGQQGKWVTFKGIFQQSWLRIKARFIGLFTKKTYAQALSDVQSEFYFGFEKIPAKSLGDYNQEAQAAIVEHDYSGDEKAKTGRPLDAREQKSKAIMTKTPAFPKKEALE